MFRKTRLIATTLTALLMLAALLTACAPAAHKALPDSQGTNCGVKHSGTARGHESEPGVSKYDRAWQAIYAGGYHSAG